MEISLNKLYLYDDVRRLLLNDEGYLCLDKDNAPMNKHIIKIHKGTDSSLKFRVFGPDRVPVNICDYELYGRMIDVENGDILLEKKCRLGSATGMVFLDITEGEITEIAIGTYNLVILGVKPFVSSMREQSEQLTTSFYTDYDNNVVTQIEVTNQAERQPIPSYTIEKDEWTPVLETTREGEWVRTLQTDAIPGNRVRNHMYGTHTYSIWAENATGTLELFGTLDETPNPSLERGWCPVYPSTDSAFIEFREFTGTEAYQFEGNFMWFKFRYTPNQDIFEVGPLEEFTSIALREALPLRRLIFRA